MSKNSIAILRAFLVAIVAASCGSAAAAAETQAGERSEPDAQQPEPNQEHPAAPPRVVREEIEWLNVWVPDGSVTDLPRVLLIGDSITQGYYNDVVERLKGNAVVARLTTSKSSGDAALLAEVSLVLSQTRFDVVHFNNGLHGWGYTEDEYAQGLPDLVAAIREGAPNAKLVWAATTPIQVAGAGGEELRGPRAARVKPRNQIAAEVMARQNIPINDLYTLVAEHAEWYSPDGTHFNDNGKSALGARVAEHLQRVLTDIAPEREP